MEEGREDILHIESSTTLPHVRESESERLCGRVPGPPKGEAGEAMASQEKLRAPGETKGRGDILRAPPLYHMRVINAP